MLSLWILATLLLQAETSCGTKIRGQVIDEKGAFYVSPVEVLIKNANGATLTKVLNQQGEFSACVTPGVYALTVENVLGRGEYRRAPLTTSSGQEKYIRIVPRLAEPYAGTDDKGGFVVKAPAVHYKTFAISAGSQKIPALLQYDSRNGNVYSSTVITFGEWTLKASSLKFSASSARVSLGGDVRLDHGKEHIDLEAASMTLDLKRLADQDD